MVPDRSRRRTGHPPHVIAQGASEYSSVMKVAAVGSTIRAYRKASGVSQKELAGMVGISRATLNYLESGRDIEIGAGKLLALLDVLAVPFTVPADIDRAADASVLESAVKGIAGKGHKKLPPKVLAEALSTGRVEAGVEHQVAQALDGVSDSSALAIVRAVSSSSGHSPATIWKNGRTVARAVGATRKVWLAES
jgi:transcriptional regulator with XRE-family HTH domain